MGSGHGHSQDHHHDHSHGDERRVFWAMLLTAGFMGVEAVGGILANSLALLADAGHMLTDAASLALAWAAFRITRRPADPARSYGYARFQVLAAFVNGGTLLAIVVWIAVEAVHRFADPAPVMGGAMLGVALAGLIVNIVVFRLLHGGNQENLNVRGAMLHVLGDMAGSVAALIAGGVILLTGWMPIDPLLSLLVAALILASAWRLVRQSAHILMEGAPAGLDAARLGRELTDAVPALRDVHHVHLWALTPERPLLTLHARLADGADADRALHDAKAVLADRFGIAHSTIQIERGACIDAPHASAHPHHTHPDAPP